jgi:hypothetical protein
MHSIYNATQTIGCVTRAATVGDVIVEPPYLVETTYSAAQSLQVKNRVRSPL